MDAVLMLLLCAVLFAGALWIFIKMFSNAAKNIIEREAKKGKKY